MSFTRKVYTFLYFLVNSIIIVLVETLVSYIIALSFVFYFIVSYFIVFI
jgi:hypothetical protein